MITKDNLSTALELLGFKKVGQKHSKTIGEATLTVDWKKGEISYPDDLVINERQTCNLLADENFIVLECVHRLLEKGYKPANIELEPKWKLGHGASGGRADILVKDNAGKPLLISSNARQPAMNSPAPGRRPRKTATTAEAIIAAAPARKQAILEHLL